VPDQPEVPTHAGSAHPAGAPSGPAGPVSGGDVAAPLTTWQERIDLLGGGAPLTPARVAAGVAAAVVVVIVAVAVLRGPPLPTEATLPLAGGPGDPAISSTTATTLAAAALVHAAGAVVDPGVYRLSADARVADLVEAAGGPLADGDLDRLNLAAPVVDGQQVYVPRVGEAVPEMAGGTGDGGAGPGGTGGPIDVNTASADALDALPGVGPATAQAILDERERRGGFASVEELLDVRGIGEAKLEALRDLVTV
jgi:competence protein ComEA